MMIYLLYSLDLSITDIIMPLREKILVELSLRTIRKIQIQICSKLNLSIHFLYKYI